MKYICDCGQHYNSAAGIESCQIANHGHPRQNRTQPAYDALVAVCPQLLEAAEKSLRWLIGERDCHYEGCSTADGEVPEADDREILASYDRDIDELRSVIAKAKGETQ